MNCPKCKMANPDTAAYCEFCYQRFKGHSAASTYLRAIERARAQEDNGGIPAATPETKKALPDSKDPVPLISLAAKRAARAVAATLTHFWRPLGLLAAGLLLLFFIQACLNPLTRFHYLGARLTYAFSPKLPVTYIFGSITDARRWSERGGQMDTPLGDLKLEDVATVDVHGAPIENRKTAVTVTSTNWLFNTYRKKGLESHTLAGQEGVLAPVHFWLDRYGQLATLHPGSSIRMAKSAVFLAPVLPLNRLREKESWSDHVQWTDPLDGWTVTWSVERHWQVEHAVRCGDDLCLELYYDALLTPHKVDEPGWMAGAVWQDGGIRGAGNVLFNVTQHTVISHHVEYAGILHAAIADVAQIPKTMRVGRRAFHAHGEILFDLKNSTSLQRN